MLSLALPLVLCALGASPVLECPVNDLGLLGPVRVGQSVFLANASVQLVAPRWRGDLGNQRSLKADAVGVTRHGNQTVYSATLVHENVRTGFRQTVRAIDGGVRVEYELAPQADTPVETVLFRAEIPLVPHCGSTRYVGASDSLVIGVFPLTLPEGANGYHFLHGDIYEWLALATADGTVLRLAGEGMSLGIQDDRKFGGQSYSLLGQAQRGTLPAGKPIRFAIELTSCTAEQLALAQARHAASILSGVPLTSRLPLRAGKVTADRLELPVYERIEWTADVQATFDNPFDPEDVALEADVATPDGRALVIAGFFDVPCRLDIRNQRERVLPTGPPRWTFRFTPTVPGKHQATVRVADRNGKAVCPPLEFHATPAKTPGFIRIAKASPRYFQFDSGQSYFPVGENVCWARTPRPIEDYTAWFGQLALHGGNWARLWLANNEKGLEWSPAPTPHAGKGAYLGLGRYSIDNSWRLDRVVRLAEQTGVRLMFCIGTFGEIKEEPDYFSANHWVSNPYNAANGGPCANPKEFFTHPAARKLYQRRLRYLMARWGYSPSLFAWEFWNEFEAPADWVREMADFFKKHDVYNHPVSTTYGNPDVWKIPSVDFTMQHFYGDQGSVIDFVPVIRQGAREYGAFGKPYLLAEFGIDWRTHDSVYDPEGKGQNLHNGLWAGTMAGGAGTPMLWYWDNYVHAQNVYSVFTPLARFASQIDWAHTAFQPLAGITVTADHQQPEVFHDLELSMGAGWGHTQPTDYRVGRDGAVEGEPIAGTLGHPYKKGLPNRISFALDMPAAGQFVLNLSGVSSRARLQVRLDDKLVLDEPLQTGPPGAGPWKSSRYYPQWKIWQAEYDRDYPIAVPAGKHVLAIANAEGDWLRLRSARVTGYRSSRYPFVHALGLGSERLFLVWLQDRASTWKSVLDKVPPKEQVGLRMTIPGVPTGRYRVAWWDTYGGKVFLEVDLTAGADGFVLPAPNFFRDVAAVIRRLP